LLGVKAMKVQRFRRNKKIDVILIGDLNPDIVLSGLSNLPCFGREELAVTAKTTLGGSTAICSCQMARLGLKVKLISKIGSDYFGKFCVDQLKQSKVGISSIKYSSSVKTGLTVSLTGTGDRALVTFLGSIAALSFDDIDLTDLRKARHLHVSSYYLQAGLRSNFPSLFREAKRLGLTTSFDPGWDPTVQWKSDILAVLEHTDVFLPNSNELLHIFGEKDVSRALDRASKIATMVVTKMGKEGAILQQEELIIATPSCPIQAVDTTGAGDSFNAGFIFAWLEGMNLENCLRYGNACGALRASAAEGTPGFFSLEEVAKFLEKHKPTMNVQYLG
jgi:sugar/nucleoside kinase (ribokinase family)